MTKKYYSKSCLSINVTLKSGKNLHVSFSSITGGGSVYYTDRTDLQEALEKHRLFGKAFIAEVQPEKVAPMQEEIDEPASKNVVKVSSLEEAKELLSDKYGVSRTKMKGVEGVKKVAEKYNILFEGI